MSTYIKLHGKTKEEAEQKAKKFIQETDYMRQPQMYSAVLEKDGTWTVTVLIRGLD